MIFVAKDEQEKVNPDASYRIKLGLIMAITWSIVIVL